MQFSIWVVNGFASQLVHGVRMARIARKLVYIIELLPTKVVHEPIRFIIMFTPIYALKRILRSIKNWLFISGARRPKSYIPINSTRQTMSVCTCVFLQRLKAFKNLCGRHLNKIIKANRVGLLSNLQKRCFPETQKVSAGSHFASIPLGTRNTAITSGVGCSKCRGRSDDSYW